MRKLLIPKIKSYLTAETKGWITLDPSGTHVFVDGSGNIEKGPQGLTGKPVSKLSTPKVKPSPFKQSEQPKVEAPKEAKPADMVNQFDKMKVDDFSKYQEQLLNGSLGYSVDDLTPLEMASYRWQDMRLKEHKAKQEKKKQGKPAPEQKPKEETKPKPVTEVSKPTEEKPVPQSKPIESKPKEDVNDAFRDSIGKTVNLTEMEPPAFIANQGRAALWKIAEKNAKLIKSVKKYTNNGYDDLNKQMRSCPPNFECVSGDDKELMDQMEEALAEAPTFKEPVTVYRGIRLSPDAMSAVMGAMQKGLQSGDPITMPCIQSTTVSPYVLNGFTNFDANAKKKPVIYQIKAKTGLYVESISENEGEFEVIKSAKAQYKVIGLQKAEYKSEKGSWGGEAMTVYLEEV